MDDWDRRHARGDTDIPSYYYDRPELDISTIYYLSSWYDLSTERPVGFSQGFIPHSKIRDYAIIDLGLVGDEIDLFVTIIRKVDNNHMARPVIDPEITDQASGPGDVKRIVTGLAKNRPAVPTRKPRVRNP